jgi:hypothetical protein
MSLTFSSPPPPTKALCAVSWLQFTRLRRFARHPGAAIKLTFQLTWAIYRAYTKEWCGLKIIKNWNPTILLCIPCIYPWHKKEFWARPTGYVQAYRLNVWGALKGKDRLLRFQRTTQSSGTSSALQCGISFHHQHHGWLCQGCTNPGHQVARATKFCTVAPNICGSWAWNLLDVTVLTPGISKRLLDLRKICAPLRYTL